LAGGGEGGEKKDDRRYLGVQLGFRMSRLSLSGEESAMLVVWVRENQVSAGRLFKNAKDILGAIWAPPLCTRCAKEREVGRDGRAVKGSRGRASGGSCAWGGGFQKVASRSSYWEKEVRVMGEKTEESKDQKQLRGKKKKSLGGKKKK